MGGATEKYSRATDIAFMVLNGWFGMQRKTKL
jgi:hypothetical protein